MDESVRHANAWNVDVSVKLGFEALGARHTFAERTHTHNRHLATEVVSFVAQWKMQGTTMDFVDRVLEGSRKLTFLYVLRAFDATPIEVEHGHLEEQLFNASRYKFLDQDGQWRLVSAQEAKRLKLRCKRGVLELLAQSATIAWEEEASLTDGRYEGHASRPMALRVEQPSLPPVFLERGNASTELSALDEALPAFSIAKLKALTAKVPWVMLHLVGDSAASNQRLKAFVELEAHNHNITSDHAGKLLVVDSGCIGHILVGILVKTFQLSKTIPRCYNLSYTFRFPPRYNRLLRVVRLRIEYDLLTGGFVPCSETNLRWTLHTQMLLSLTILRPLRTRGRGFETSTAQKECLG